MFSQTKTMQLFYVRHLHQLNAILNMKKTASSFTIRVQSKWKHISCPVNFTLLRNRSGLIVRSGVGPSHRVQSALTLSSQSCWFATNVEERTGEMFDFNKNACPQGVQGDDCVTFKLWLDNCRRYGLANCNDQLQGIQSGRKTLNEVIAEQEKLIADIATQYRSAASNKHGYYNNHQGVQDTATSISTDYPCPQGVQGYDCANFKLWLENCQRSGLHNCTHQFEHFKTGRKSLAEIFAEQDQLITEAATPAFQKASKHRREYSTSTKNYDEGGGKSESDKTAEAPLTQSQKLKRAVKEYGTTVIVFHVSLSLISLGFFYLLVTSGIDIVGLLMKLGIDGSLLQNKLATGTGTLVVAYAVHKVFAPLRIAATLTATPFIVRYLRKIGFLKAPKHSKSN